jgi:hypothetical protein
VLVGVVLFDRLDRLNFDSLVSGIIGTVECETSVNSSALILEIPITKAGIAMAANFFKASLLPVFVDSGLLLFFIVWQMVNRLK